MHVYNPVADQWTRLADVPAELTHQAVAIDGNTIWSLGGTVGDSPGTVVDSVYLYDVTANTWSTGPSLPAPRGGGQTVILGRNLHFFGGFLPDRQTGSLDHWVMNLDNLAAGWSSLAAMPEPRNHFAGVGLNGKIYALGGATGHDTGPRDVAFVHVYNPASNQWTQLASLPVAASHIETGTFVQDGRIFVTGGRSNVTGQKLLDTFYSYDPNTNSWSSLPPLPRPTRVHVARVINGMLIVGNGEYPHAEPQDEYYAIPWSIVQSALNSGAAPLALAASSTELLSVNEGDGLSSDGCGCGGCPCGGLGCAACMPAPVELAAAPDRWTLAPIRRLGSPKAQVTESVLQPIGGNLELLKEYDLLGLSRSILARDKLFEEDSLRANELAEDLAHAQALRLDVELDFSPEIKKELDFSHYG
jgi:N-acetylneuraminic acid mutarotase